MARPVQGGETAEALRLVWQGAVPVLSASAEGFVDVAYQYTAEDALDIEITIPLADTLDSPEASGTLSRLSAIADAASEDLPTPSLVRVARDHAVLSEFRDGETDDVAVLIASDSDVVDPDALLGDAGGLTEAIASDAGWDDLRDMADMADDASALELSSIDADGSVTPFIRTARAAERLIETLSSDPSLRGLFDPHEDMTASIDIFEDDSRGRRVAVLSSLSRDGMRPRTPRLRAVKAVMQIGCAS